MINNSITFFTKYYTYFNIFLPLILSKAKRIKTIPKVKNEDMIPNRILKKRSKDNVDNFLITTWKLSNKKRLLTISFKQKFNIDKQKSKIIIISFFNDLDKENLFIIIFIPIFDKSIMKIIIISIDAYCIACKLKKA